MSIDAALHVGHSKESEMKQVLWVGLVLLVVGHVNLALAGSGEPMTFNSPEAASEALFLAVKSHDEPALTQVLGAGSELVDSDDAAQDRLDREQFVEKYQEMHRLAREGEGVVRLFIGAENWPFPVPLVSQNQKWRFDCVAGAREVQFRRIGANEMAAIDLGRSLLGKAGAGAGDADDVRAVENGTQPVRGYYFRMARDSQGDRAIVAYPAEYRSSGVMTFILNQNGEVREKDLGPDTTKLAPAILGHDTPSTWVLVEEP